MSISSAVFAKLTVKSSPQKLLLPSADLDPLLSKAQTPLVQFHEKNTGNVRFDLLFQTEEAKFRRLGN